MKKNKINKFLPVSFIFSFLMVGVVSLTPAISNAEPEFSWHGQFRINSYSEFRGDKGSFDNDENQRAARLRWRPTVDVKMSESVSLHTQINIGHIKSNIYQSSTVALRHAVIQAELFDTGITGMAGLVPISDKFGDTLFSGDWDFNPLALVFVSNTGEIAWRAGLGKLQEGDVEGGGTDPANDDLDIYIFDVDHSSGIGASVYYLRGGDDRSALENRAGESVSLIVYGGRWSGEFGDAKINAFVAGSSYKSKNYFASGDLKANGFAGKLEVKFPVQDMTIGIMGLASSGDKDFRSTTGSKSSFITPMSIVGTTGYWGYTGRLNEQGPTDTGIDSQTLNLDGGGLPWSSYDNLGYGIVTVQANLSVPVNDVLGAYFGVGYYASTDAPSAQGNYIGTDIYAQGKLNLGQNLNLEFGVDHLAAAKGHYNNVSTGKSRSNTLIFSRLQLEY